jgi:low affinity Fe/Cu permease
MNQEHHALTLARALERLAHAIVAWTRTSWAFVVALGLVVGWTVGGLVLGFSDFWLLLINTGTNIVTFLMIFLMQRSQAKEAVAVHLKLNEIVAALEGASNRLINVETLSEEQILAIQQRYVNLARSVGTDEDKIARAVSVEHASAEAQSPD